MGYRLEVSNMKLSFVIPVYNVEKYLNECVDSILNQMTDECEIILVDDGSTDSSGKICDEYVRTNSNISVIHKENGGLSSARNAGLASACGKYVTFVDSDDRIENGSVNQIIDCINKQQFDICFMQTSKFYPDGTKEDLGEGIYKEHIYGKDIDSIMSFLRKCPKYPGSAANKIYRYAFLKDNNLSFPKDRRYSEDLGFIRDCIQKAEKFMALDFPYYEYRQNRKGSITNGFSDKNYFDLLLFVEETVEKIQNSNMKMSETDKTMLAFAAYEYSICLWKLPFVSEDSFKKAEAFLKKYKWILKYGENKLIRIICLLVNLFGIRITAEIIDFYKKNKR